MNKKTLLGIKLQKTKRLSRGFTILEVLIASVLIGVGVFAIMEVFNRGFSNITETENYSLALSLTQETMEELKDSAFSSLSTHSVTPNAPYSTATFQQQVTVTDVLANYLKQVTVTTSWSVFGFGSPTSVSLTTYIANTG